MTAANGKRRQLNAGQRGGLAQEFADLYAEAIKAEETKRKAAAVGDKHGHHANSASTSTKWDPAKSKSTERNQSAAAQAAQATGASPDAVKRMKALRRDAPDLAGELTGGQP